jgi:catechol 2,3-dioxygenase-like lactoylglutathione lyase family enzyme
MEKGACVDVARMHHAGLTVASLERSLAFYVGALGFETRSRRVIDAPWLSQLLGIEAAVVDAVDLAVPGTDQVIQLFEFSLPNAERVEPDMTRPGSVHLAFIVTGMRALLDRLAEVGATSVAPPVTITSGANAGGMLVCVRDPDGVVVEFYEAPRSPQAGA